MEKRSLEVVQVCRVTRRNGKTVVFYLYFKVS